MEIIKKVISLEPFRSRMKSTIPFVGMYSRRCPECGRVHSEEITGATWTCEYCNSVNESEEASYNPGLNWGKIPYDVDFPVLVASLEQQEAVNLYGNGIKQLGRMTFQEIMESYHLVKNNNIPMDADEEEVEKLRAIVSFVDSKKVIDLPKPYADPCCNPCQVPSPSPVYEMDAMEDYYVPPQIYLNLCIVQSANIVGAYTFATKNWVAGKRYFAGDKVLYDGKTFKLKEFDGVQYISSNGMKIGFLVGTDLEAEAFDDYSGLSDDLFTVVKNETEAVDQGLIYARKKRGEDEWTYYIRPSWGGYVNKYDGDTYFDNLLTDYIPERGFKMLGQYETVHWKVADKILSHGVYKIPSITGIGHEQDRNIGYNTVTINSKWESKLVNFKRSTKTITVDGTELPGKLLSTSGSPSLDLQYIVGTTKNIDTTGDITIGDYLAEIKFTQRNEDHTNILTLGPGDSFNDAQIPAGTPGHIIFTYYIGAELKYDSDAEKYVYDGGNKGAVYKDTYEFLSMTYTADEPGMAIEGRDTGNTFVYIDIDYDSARETAYYESIDNYYDRPILSQVTFTKQSMTEGGEPVSPDFQNADYFMEDYQLGMSFVSNNNSNVYIDRGNATAFERHMRLSEVDTLQDLENYGNGMFKLKE